MIVITRGFSCHIYCQHCRWAMLGLRRADSHRDWDQWNLLLYIFGRHVPTSTGHSCDKMKFVDKYLNLEANPRRFMWNTGVRRYTHTRKKKETNKITLLRVIPTMTFIRFVTGTSSGILSDISSGILSGISSGTLSGISYLLQYVLAYLLTFYLAFSLANLLAFYLANILALYLA